MLPQPDVSLELTTNPFGTADDTLVTSVCPTHDDFKGPGPFVVETFHGTIHTFDRFDAKKANVEGAFGSMIYFTTDAHDAWVHYAQIDGPDRTNILQQKIESLTSNMLYGDWEYETDEEPTEAEIEAKCTALARAEILGDAPLPQLLHCAVRLETPCVLNAWKGPTFLLCQQLEDKMGEIDVPEDEDDEDEDARFEAMDKCTEWFFETLTEKAWEVERLLNLPQGEISISGIINSGDTSFTTDWFVKAFEEDNKHLTDYETDQHIVSQATVLMLRAVGYDSIVLLNAHQQFKYMKGMNSGVCHVHLFEHTDHNIQILERYTTPQETIALQMAA